MYEVRNPPPARSATQHRILRRLGAVGVAALAFAIATVDTAAEASEFWLESGTAAPSE